jgi:hypothetical protein
MITTRIFNAVPGSYILWHPSLNGVNVLSVDRTGFGQDENPDIMVANTEFYHTGGFIVFSPGIPFNIGEKVQVIYET